MAIKNEGNIENILGLISLADDTTKNLVIKKKTEKHSDIPLIQSDINLVLFIKYLNYCPEFLY